MDKESWVLYISQWPEISIEGVLGILTENRFEKLGKCILAMGVVGQTELAAMNSD